MKRFHILLLTFLLIINVSTTGLVADVDNPTSSLSQLTNTPKTNSPHSSILNVESTEQEINNDQVESSDEITEQTLDDTTSENPEHLSGPMNADLRENLNEAPIEEVTPEPLQDTSSISEDNSETTESAPENTTSIPLEDSAQAEEITQNEVNPDQLTNQEDTPTKSDSMTTTEISDLPQSSTDYVKDQADVRELEESASQPVEEIQPVDQSQSVEQTHNESLNTKIDESLPNEELPDKEVLDEEPLNEKLPNKEPLDEKTIKTFTPKDELTKQEGILPKVGFLLREFGKWLNDLINSVEAIL